MFSYKPRTRDFVEEHVDVLRQLPAWPSAVNVLAGFDGLGDYLLSRGERHIPIDARERADLTLRVLLATMHAETGDFLHTPGRTASATAELARCVMGGREEATIVVPLLGVRLEAERLDLEHGLALVRDDTIQDLPRDARSPVRGRPGTLAVVEVLADPSGAAGLAVARPRLRALLTALRLYDRPAPALAPVAWARVRGGGWASHPFIGTCARASGTLHLQDAHADAVRGFCDLVARAGRLTGPTAWSLRRFELACERADHAEALTDTLLALRGLLEADQLGSELMGDRLAALCARPEDWVGLRDRAHMAEAVEVALMQGTPVDDAQVRDLSVELRGHLRALLRDVACGHLSGDLAVVADRHRAGVVLPPSSAPVIPAPVAVAPALAEPESPLPEPELAAPALAEEAEPTEQASLGHAPIFDDGGAIAAGTIDHAPFDDATSSVDVLDARIELADELQDFDDLFFDVAPQPLAAELRAVTPPPAVLQPAPPAPGQHVAAQVEARRAPVLSDRELMPNGERFEDAFVRSLTEGPGAIR
jgi:hypothetical protein